VDSELLDALEVYLELQKKRLERRAKERLTSSTSPELAELAHAN
jgi:hypothetical protein